MDPGDEVLYPNPGYPIYESQIEFLGGVAKPYGYVAGAKTSCSTSTRIEARHHARDTAAHLQQPAEPHRCRELRRGDGARWPNWPSSTICTCCRDEAYWDIRYSGASRSIASLPGMAERTVILYTFSKKFAMTGWRLGAAIGPPRTSSTYIAKLNVNDESCSNHFIQ